MRARGILAALLVLALVPWDAEAALPVDPNTGNTVVTEDTTVRNETIAPGLNLLVSDATLTLTDCRVVMHDFTIIQVTGALVMRNVSISNNGTGGGFNFVCSGRLDMDNCVVSGAFTWRLDVRSHDCAITNSTFNLAGSGIEISNGTPLLRANRFIGGVYKSYLSPLIFVRNAAPVIENNSFDGYLMRFDGLEIFYPDSPVVANNTFFNCSTGLAYRYIHQHAGDGTVSPPPGEPARLEDNTFRRCSYGLFTSDADGGVGRGGAGDETQPRIAPGPVFVANNNLLEGNSAGISADGDAPSVVENCEFRDNGCGIELRYSEGMRLFSDGFTNNSVGLTTLAGDLYMAGSVFNTNDRNIDCVDTVATIEFNSFIGGGNTSVSLSGYSVRGNYFANNTVIGGNTIGVRIEGTAVVFNNSIRDCPVGLYRAVRQYGQGHGRDFRPPPPAVTDMAVITQNRFGNNTRGIFTEGWSEITENIFSENWAGVEASRFIHPLDTSSGAWQMNSELELLTIGWNTFRGGSTGVLLLHTDYLDYTGPVCDIQWNDFVDNDIGIDAIGSEPRTLMNNFSLNGGWAFRQVGSGQGVSENFFGQCDRAWRQKLVYITVFEPPGGDLQAPLYDWERSDNATVQLTNESGAAFLFGNTTRGRPPPFSPDGLAYFQAVNLTYAQELADGTVVESGPLQAEAWKPGVGYASGSLDLFMEDNIELYLRPVPDLQVRDFSFNKTSAVGGEMLVANYTILNDNTYDPTNSSLKNVLIDVFLDGDLVKSVAIPLLRAGVPENRTIGWTATPGNHTWTVLVDPTCQFNDFSRGNNRAEVRLDINGRPVAILEAARDEALTAELFEFSGNGSSDDGAVAAYRFDPGDGSALDWSGFPSMVYSYARAGAYSARLQVRDDRSLESEWSPAVTVTVVNRLPSVELSAGATDVLTGEEVDFSVVASDPEGTPLTVSWDFGDGSQRTGTGLTSLSHAFADDGCFTVRAVVSEPDGGAASSSVEVKVRNRPPTARFAPSPSQGSVLTPFSFLPAASDPDGRVVSYCWDLGDNTASMLDRPLHSYAAPGAYNVTLAVRDDDGDVSGPFTLPVTVENLPPVARACISTSRARTGQAVTFNATGSFDPEGPAIAIRWDFGDGSRANGTAARHVFSRPGNYTVICVVTDADGAATEVLLPVLVTGPDNGRAGTDWRFLALLSAFLALAALVAVAAVLGRRPQKPPPRRTAPAPRPRLPPSADVYAEKLARSRENGRRPAEKGNRSMYDSMQPVREDGKNGKNGN